ncbi:hypothetical protein CYLTODRAFT_358363, partial [Cylindrobasidium torrendii FP15055 ss-10]
TIMSNDRKVFLPLEKLDSCSKCSKKAQAASELKLCAACKEVAYCSKDCQESDWPQHKSVCGENNDYIDLESFYPILSNLGDAVRLPLNGEALHPALTRKIVGPPKPFMLPDGSVAGMVEIGPLLANPSDMGSEKWWSPSQGGDIPKRIVTEGQVLPVCISLAMSLMAAIYTTNFNKKAGARRTRLMYKDSPIADFGIAHGTFEAPLEDRLAYYDGETIFKGQDPDDHYWLWFRTARGEEVIFDGSLYTFNFCVMSPGEPYCAGVNPELLPYNWAGTLSPGFFIHRELNRNHIALHKESRRISVLRDPRLQRAVRLLYASTVPPEDEEETVKVYYKEDIQAIREIFGEFSSPATASQRQKDPLIPIMNSYRVLDDILSRKAWKAWPKGGLVGIDTDPGEDRHFGNTELHKKIVKWNRQFKKGLMTRDEYDRGTRELLDSV